MHGEHQLAWSAANEMLDAGEREANIAMKITAHRRIGWTALYRGELDLVPRHIDESLRLCTTQYASSSFDYKLGSDPGVLGRCVRIYHQWLIGLQDKASHTAGEAVRCARDSEHPYTLVYALTYSTQRAIVDYDTSMATELAGESISLAKKHGFLLLHSWALISAGWAASREGDLTSGLSQFLEGLSSYTKGGQTLFRPFFLSLLAELYLTQEYGVLRLAEESEFPSVVIEPSVR